VMLQLPHRRVRDLVAAAEHRPASSSKDYRETPKIMYRSLLGLPALHLK
jgi:hypothetical protein